MVSIADVSLVRPARRKGRGAAGGRVAGSLDSRPADQLPGPRRENGDETAKLDSLFRIARSATTREAAIWAAIDALTKAKRYSQALTVLEERRGELNVRRAAFHRTDVLLAQGGQGRQREALAALLQAESSGAVEPESAVDHLLRAGALTLAATFLQRSVAADGAHHASLRAAIARAARDVCRQTTLQASPFAFADAVRALQLLSPDDASIAAHVRRAAIVLGGRLRMAAAKRDHASATEFLIRLTRLAPHDLDLLDQLAATAGRAGRYARRLDTLVRIHRLRRDPESLRQACEAAFSLRRWNVMAQIVADFPAGAACSQILPDAVFADTLAQVRDRARREIDALLGEDAFEAALALVAALDGWVKQSDWPSARWSSLMSRTKRHLCSAGADSSTTARIAKAYLALNPGDTDVERLLARLHLRLRRFGAARAAFEHLMLSDPHLARDWLDLGAARHELGDERGSDICALRAWLIDPEIATPIFMDGALERLAAP